MIILNALKRIQNMIYDLMMNRQKYSVFFFLSLFMMHYYVNLFCFKEIIAHRTYNLCALTFKYLQNIQYYN